MKPTLDHYATCLKTYNEHTNVYSKKAYDHLPFHIQDSVNMANLIGNEEVTVVDMGSGSGLPSIPIAITNPSNTVIAVESNGKKATFLMQTGVELGLKNYSVLQMDAHQIHRQKLKIDVLTAKAFKPIEEVIQLAKRVAPKARLIVPLSQVQVENVSDPIQSHIQTLDVDGVRYFYYLIS